VSGDEDVPLGEKRVEIGIKGKKPVQKTLYYEYFSVDDEAVKYHMKMESAR
jgi:hypothetical protein